MNLSEDLFSMPPQVPEILQARRLPKLEDDGFIRRTAQYLMLSITQWLLLSNDGGHVRHIVQTRMSWKTKNLKEGAALVGFRNLPLRTTLEQQIPLLNPKQHLVVE